MFPLLHTRRSYAGQISACTEHCPPSLRPIQSKQQLDGRPNQSTRQPSRSGKEVQQLFLATHGDEDAGTDADPSVTEFDGRQRHSDREFTELMTVHASGQMQTTSEVFRNTSRCRK